MKEPAAPLAQRDARRPEGGNDRDELPALLSYIRDARGFDFSAYKSASLTRRIQKRMREVGVSGYLNYRDLLESDSEEFASLFNTILINVTAFFRDVEAWNYLRRAIVPDILRRADPAQEIRVWSAGCSSGEEAYTLAMVFAEALGVDRALERLKIYGTDIDDGALAHARSGMFSANALETVPENLRSKYFYPNDGRSGFRDDLRRRVIFGHHDITKDAPISRLDLVVCRNTMMYLNSEAQLNVFGRFHFALREGGYLFLGLAETLPADGTRFQPTDPNQRVFQNIDGRSGPAAGKTAPPSRDPQPVKHEISRRRHMRDLVLDGTPDAMIALAADGTVALINGQVRERFGLRSHDVGKPFHDLEISYRPTELRSPVERVLAERHTVRINNVERRVNPDELSFYDIVIQPLMDDDEGSHIGVVIYFIDTTGHVRLRDEVKRTHDELETAYEELQSTNEELETTNEELQSSNEELETTNEELQSTNEELETANHALQTSNKNLERMNDEVHQRSAQLDEARIYLEGVLAGVPAGVVVLDVRFRVRSWSRGAEDLWGLRGSEVWDQPFFDLDFGLPTDRVREIIDECLAGGRRTGPVTLEAVNRIGHSITCSITCSPLHDRTAGVVILMEQRDGSSKQRRTHATATESDSAPSDK